MELALKSFWPVIDRSWKGIQTTCDNASCHNTQLMRTIPGGRTGVKVAERWYCSIDCFVSGSQFQLGKLFKTRPESARREPRMSVGLVLVSKGQLTPEQLKFAYSECELRHESLEATLLRLDFVNEKQLSSARAAQWGYPFIANDHIGHALSSDVPSHLMEEFSAVPVECSDKARRILMGFVFRVEHSLLESIESVTGYNAVPCFITPTQFKQQMQQVSIPQDHSFDVVCDPGSPEQVSRILGQYGIEVGAKEVILSQCGKCLWSRLIGKKRKVDVVFRFSDSERARHVPAQRWAEEMQLQY